MKLIVDTSNHALILLLIWSNGETKCFYDLNTRDFSANTAEQVSTFLKANSVKPSDLTEVVAGVGPGSYTGTRVAVTIVKTLAYALNIPAYSISSLALFASTLKQENAIIYKSARNQNYYVGVFANNQAVEADVLLKENELNELISKKPDFKAIELSTITYFNVEFNIKLIENSLVLVDSFALEPNYLRKTEAEINYDQKNNKWAYFRHSFNFFKRRLWPNWRP